jgi:hypothetical protein
MQEFQVGDFVWFTHSLRQIYYRSRMFRSDPLMRPLRLKIIQIVETKNGILYQTKHGHFHESLVSESEFRTEKEAIDKMKNIKTNEFI